MGVGLGTLVKEDWKDGHAQGEQRKLVGKKTVTNVRFDSFDARLVIAFLMSSIRLLVCLLSIVLAIRQDNLTSPVQEPHIGGENPFAEREKREIG